MKIGLLSDTHGFLEPSILEHFQACDEIWHAGDIGTHALADELEHFKPLRAVYGNIDDAGMRKRYPEDNWFDCGDFSVLLTHIAGSPPNFNPRMKKVLKEKKADILVCGHSHILRVIQDKKSGLLYLNPGAAGRQGFHHVKTILRFDIDKRNISNMEVIELGRRGQIIS